MNNLSVTSLDNQNLREEVQKKLRSNDIPTGLYGSFEELIIKTCLILGTSQAKIKRPATLLFAADHGFRDNPKAPIHDLATPEKVYKVLNTSSPGSLLHKQNRMHIKVVDVGVQHQFESNLLYWLNHGKKLVNRKISESTRDFMEFPAMTTSACNQAIDIGSNAVLKEYKGSCNLIGISSLASGSELSAEIISIALLQVNPKDFDFEAEKYQFIKKALNQHPKTKDPLTLLSLFGGYELAAMCGAYTQAAASRMIILVDGFESALALYIASQWNPKIKEYCILGNKADNDLHKLLLQELDLYRQLDNYSSAGEAYSIAMTFPLVNSACTLIRELPSTE